MSAPTRTDGVVAVTVLVERAMRRNAEDRRRAFDLPKRTAPEQAHRAALLAASYARAERWWRLLDDAVIAGRDGLPPVVSEAARCAAADARSSARFWAETARYWQGRAEGLTHAEADDRARGWSA